MANRKYSAEEKAHAIAQCLEIGPNRASRELKIPYSTLFVWARLRADNVEGKRKRRGGRAYTPAEVDHALQLVETEGLKSAATELSISVATLERWRADARKVGKRQYTSKERAHALERVKAVGLAPAARELGISIGTLRPWVVNAGLLVPKERPPRQRHSVEFRSQAVSLAEKIGFDAAAATLHTSAQNIRYWTNNKNKILRVQTYSQKFKEDAIRLADQTSISRAAKELNIPINNIRAWKKKSNSNLGIYIAPITRNPSPELRVQAIELAGKIGDEEAALQLNVRVKSIARWRSEAKPIRREVNFYSDDEIHAAVELAKSKGVIYASHHFGFNERTVRNWLRKVVPVAAKRELPRAKEYAEETRALAIELLKSDSKKAVAKRLQISEQTLSRWAIEENIGPLRKNGVQTAFDQELKWIERDYPDLKPWLPWAREWLKGEKHSIGTRLAAIRVLLINFIHQLKLPLSPYEFLLRSQNLPRFSQCWEQQSSHSVSLNNFAHEFIEWIILNKIGGEDDFGNAISLGLFRNPIQRMSHAGIDSPGESVYSPLPYGYIEELRGILAMGNSFSDWKWAQGQLDGASRTMDWFPVTIDQVDPNDPDCVTRTRLRGQISGGEVLEMWSPVRWVALLLKLILPLRTFQVRMLDSGEADTWECRNYDADSGSKSWCRNEGKLAEGNARRPLRLGVLREAPGEAIDAWSAQCSNMQLALYISTNKTADIHAKGEKGYVVPWVAFGGIHNDPYYWITKLIKWQKKYNPITRRTKWSELDGRHVDAKSDLVLASHPDACFLFRMAESKNGERHLPLTDSAINVGWYMLLEHYENKLADLGRTHADGSRIWLLPKERKLNSRRVLFPLHSLRVSLITVLALEGKVPFPILKRIVGHSRILMTIYYTKPSAAYMTNALTEAAVRIEDSKEAGIVEFLRTASYDDAMRELVCNSAAAIATVLPEHITSRSAVGWKHLHHGLCMVGGNVNAFESTHTLGGCFNGGANVGSVGKDRWLPVPGGAHNCVRCRWFVTTPSYLWALVAHFNVLAYHLDEARNASVAAGAKLEEFKIQRIDCEDLGASFLMTTELEAAQRVWEVAMQRFDDLVHDVAACTRLITRCQNALNAAASTTSGGHALIAVGSELEVRLAIEETESELLQLAGVCEAISIYPEMAVGKAVVRRSQLLDSALYREGYKPLFMRMTEEEQLRNGNAFLQKLGAVFDPLDIRGGQRKAISLIDAQKHLAHEFGASLSELFTPSEGSFREISLEKTRDGYQ